MKHIIDFWPLKTPPRNNQLKAFDWLEKQTAKYILLEAPVGSGKSAIAVSYAKWLNNGMGTSFILTPQRILQEQYEKSFDRTRLFSLYGKVNYKCEGKSTNCQIGDMIKPRCSNCPHRKAKEIAVSSANTVLNYKLGMTVFGNDLLFEPRALMVADECHNLEQELTEFDSVSVSALSAKKYGLKWDPIHDLKTAHVWITTNYLPKVKSRWKHLSEMVEPLSHETNLTPDDIDTLREFNDSAEHLTSIERIVEVPEDQLMEHFVLVHDEQSIKFKRLYAHQSFKTILDPKASKFLFMSSTILDMQGFCRDLGIDPKQAAFLSLESEFEPENRPVFFMPTMKMNKQWKEPENEKNRDRLLVKILQTLNLHKEHSGIIHTANFAIAQWLVDELSCIQDTHEIFHHNPGTDLDRNQVIDGFINCPRPAVLISPSITEGLDLKDDLGRFAIFAKIPYPNLGDQWIKRRMEISNDWYQRQALVSIIQGGGRVVRSEQDWGNVYILDSSWGYLYQNTEHKLPKWWLDSYCTMS